MTERLLREEEKLKAEKESKLLIAETILHLERKPFLGITWETGLL